uniref:Uncharacterized protein n=1 Tax=Dunaliella tertiolecta TaxID=3047 RepID=A0A7S3QZG9_DUNTE
MDAMLASHDLLEEPRSSRSSPLFSTQTHQQHQHQQQLDQKQQEQQKQQQQQQQQDHQQQQQQHIQKYLGESSHLLPSRHFLCAQSQSQALEPMWTGDGKSSACVGPVLGSSGLLGWNGEATSGTATLASASKTHRSPRSCQAMPTEYPAPDPQGQQEEAGMDTCYAETEQAAEGVDAPALENGNPPSRRKSLWPPRLEGPFLAPEPSKSQARFNIAAALRDFTVESTTAHLRNMEEPQQAVSATGDEHRMPLLSASSGRAQGVPPQDPGLWTQSESQAAADDLNLPLNTPATLQHAPSNPVHLLPHQPSSGVQGASLQVHGPLQPAYAENSAVKQTEPRGLPKAWVSDHDAPSPQGQRVLKPMACVVDEPACNKAPPLNGCGDFSSPGGMQAPSRHVLQLSSGYGWDVQSSSSNALAPGRSLADMPSSLSTPAGSNRQLPLLAPEGLTSLSRQLSNPDALEQVAQREAHACSGLPARPFLNGGQNSCFQLQFSVHALQQRQQQDQADQGPHVPLATASSAAASRQPPKHYHFLDHLYSMQQQQQQQQQHLSSSFSVPGLDLHRLGDPSLQKVLKDMLEPPRFLGRVSGTSSWLRSEACTSGSNTVPACSRVATSTTGPSLSSRSSADDVAVAVGGLQRALAIASPAGLSVEEMASLQALLDKLAALQQHQQSKQKASNQLDYPTSLQTNKAHTGAKSSFSRPAITPFDAATAVPASRAVGVPQLPPGPRTVAYQHTQPTRIVPFHQALGSNCMPTPSGQECTYPADDSGRYCCKPECAANGNPWWSCETADDQGPVKGGLVIPKSSTSMGKMSGQIPLQGGPVPQTRTVAAAGSTIGVDQGHGAVLGQQGYTDQQHQQQRRVQHKQNPKDTRRHWWNSSAKEGPTEGLRLRVSASHPPSTPGSTGAVGSTLGMQASSSLEEPANLEGVLLWRGESSGPLPLPFTAPSTKGVQAFLLVAGCVVAVFNVLMILLVMLSSQATPN